MKIHPSVTVDLGHDGRMKEQKPYYRPRGSWLGLTLRNAREMRIRIFVIAMLAVASVVTAYFGQMGWSTFIRGLLIGFALLTLLRFYNWTKHQ